MNTLEKDKRYIMSTYGRYNIEITGGKGSTVYDSTGREYIDFTSGIAVNTFGQCDSEWINAVTAQLGVFQHTSNYFATKPAADLAELLTKRTNMSKVFFSNSGAEANECAIKAARKYGTDKNENKNVIITLKNSFHGRTITTLSATGQEVFHKNFTPFTKGFRYVEANNIEELEKAFESGDCCSVMFEIIQGEGGVVPLEKDFVLAAEAMAKQNDALLIVDEVQTGNGRTGRLFAYEHFGIKPDIITTAKGLGGGLPIGATLFNEKLSQILPQGSHGSTFGGNPVCAAGALNILGRITEPLLKQVWENGEYIKKRLEEINGIKQVFGMGYMLGAEIEGDAHAAAGECLKNGLLILTAKERLRLLPALNIKKGEIDKGLKILEKTLND